jgi:hypothetical protein
MWLRILKSAGVAIVTCVVCANTYLLALMIEISVRHWPQTGAVGFDLVSAFMHGWRFQLVLVSSLCLAAAYSFHTFNRGRLLAIPLIAATLSFLVATAAAGLLLFAVAATTPHLDGGFPWASAIGMWSVDIGTLGFFAGLVGGAWLAQRRAGIRSTGRLVVESAAAGAPLGAVLALLVMSSGTPSPSLAQMLVAAAFLRCPESCAPCSSLLRFADVSW